MKIHTFGINLPKDGIIGCGYSPREAEDMCRKAYNLITTYWEEEYAPKDWSKAKDYFGTCAIEELEIPCAIYGNEPIKNEEYK